MGVFSSIKTEAASGHLLLGIPVRMIVKAIGDRVEDIKPVGEFSVS
ncbi:MAG: hypothetical protein V4614_12375 [Pseudomonadota bacterium]